MTFLYLCLRLALAVAIHCFRAWLFDIALHGVTKPIDGCKRALIQIRCTRGGSGMITTTKDGEGKRRVADDKTTNTHLLRSQQVKGKKVVSRVL